MNDVMKGDIPQYQKIKHSIYQGIREGRYPRGGKVPTEYELMAIFNVSRMTVNRAIRELVGEGILVRYAGVGTFVTDLKHESPLVTVRNIAVEVQERGHQYHAQVLSLAEVLADETVAVQLGVPLDTPVFHSEIVHFEEGVPIQWEYRYVNAASVPHYLEQNFEQTTPNEYLSIQCPLTNIEHTVEAVLPSAEEAKLLQIDPAEPCLLLHRRTWSDKKLISWAKLLHPGSRYKLRSKSVNE
ncbi:histidine utilization repressor [Zooshikella ganghwensis]|nr:histidine utilization repressor [Zooshikella ganghwensis]